ncbi:MAG: hypothetical protein JWN04_393 [Myxococcaceae bacterium]|nr:hypothetical protein [Myxococcaceae bacterium]
MLLIPHTQLRLAAVLRRSRVLGLLWPAWCALTGCLAEQRYQITDAAVVMTPELAPAFLTQDDAPVFRIDAPFLLRITPPSDAELARLSAGAQGMMLPFPRLPWVKLHDLELQLDYAITNQSPNALLATVTVNGINEFVYYAPGPEDLHQWQRRIALAPGQRVSGTITDVELDEVATDLATVVNGAPNSNLVVTFQSQSGRDPRVQPFIPKVIPGLDGLRAGIETTGQEGASAPALTLELTVHVRDLGDRACARDKKPWQLPGPAPFTPIAPDPVTN